MLLDNVAIHRIVHRRPPPAAGAPCRAPRYDERRASSSEAPNPHMTAPLAWRSRTISAGRFSKPARAIAAQQVTKRSALVLRHTETRPRTMNWTATGRTGSMN